MHMKNVKDLSTECANKLFRYDRNTGQLRWRLRHDVPEGVNRRFVGQIAGSRHTCTAGKSYIQVRVNNRLYYAHRIIWVINNGEIPDGMQIDHINGDGLDNSLKNLRLVTNSQNKRNQRRLSTNTSGRTGVYFDKRRNSYCAAGFLGDKKIHLGSGLSFDEACKKREAFEIEHGFHKNHGEVRPL